MSVCIYSLNVYSKHPCSAAMNRRVQESDDKDGSQIANTSHIIYKYLCTYATAAQRHTPIIYHFSYVCKIEPHTYGEDFGLMENS